MAGEDIIFNERELAIISASTKRVGGRIQDTENSVTQLNRLMWAVIVVLFVGFLAMVVGIGAIVWSAHQVYATSYNEYRTTVQSLQDEIQQRKEKDIGDKLEKMQQEVDSLWKTKYPIRK